jgi:hypothetical protein
VPFAKRKTGRGPLQRLSDQRRSLALAGLAVGAVVSAAVLRRKRRGAEAEFGTPETAPSTSTATPGTTPTTATSASEVVATADAATATQTDQEAPETAAAAAASQGDQDAETAAQASANEADEEAPEADAALNAAVELATPADVPEPEPEKKASTTLSEPTTGELNAEEASILAVLAQHGRTDEDRSVIAVATSLERQSADVANVLRKLSAEGVVSGELYTATGDKIWAVTERGVRRLGAQH